MKNKHTFKDYLTVAKVIGTFALVPAIFLLILYCYAYGITIETFL